MRSKYRPSRASRRNDSSSLPFPGAVPNHKTQVIFRLRALKFVLGTMVAWGSLLATVTTSKYDSAPSLPFCPFRQYAPNLFYGLTRNQNESTGEHDEELHTILGNSQYIRGRAPFILTADTSQGDGKVCVDQSSWLKHELLPHADGTNPSILSKHRIEQATSWASHQEATESTEAGTLLDLMTRHEASFLATLVFKRQTGCSWNDSPEQQVQYNLSSYAKDADITGTLLLLLKEDGSTLWQSFILLERDAPVGGKVKNRKRKQQKQQPTPARERICIDDTRLFLHQGRVWISFKLFSEGKDLFIQQIMSPLHFDNSSAGSSDQQGGGEVYIRASEMLYVCCGRNMAVLEDNMSRGNPNPQIELLTFVNPVTVATVTEYHTAVISKVSLGATPLAKQMHLQVSSNTQPSAKAEFHGTTGFLLRLPETNEHLGIGHFHRPADEHQYNWTNAYAPFGHHYTHAFFTISRTTPNSTLFHLKRLSDEFVFQAKSKLDDAEIIQFASGLELTRRNGIDYVVVGYGINDCEGAFSFIKLERIQRMLQPVAQGESVGKLMKPLIERGSKKET